MMKIGGSNGDLDFTEFTAGVTSASTSSVKDAVNLEFKAVLASVGIAAAWGTGAATVIKAPKVEPKARQQTRSWGYVLEGFPVGAFSRDVPAGLMTAMQQDGDQMRTLYEGDIDALRELGMAPEKFRLRFLVEGFASRVWAGAANEAERREENRRLSGLRAFWMQDQIEAKFGTDHFYEMPVGRGAALFARQGEGGPKTSDIVAEGDTDALDRLVERYRQRLLADNPTMPAVELDQKCADYRKGVEKSNPKDGWAPAAQRVNIKMSWSGPLVDYGMAGDVATATPVAPAAK